MSDQDKKSKTSASKIGNALFDSTTAAAANGDTALPSFAELFLDKIRALHEHFDKDKDGYLNFAELSSLQVCTSGNTMDRNTYAMVCKALACHPNQGVSIEALKLTYAAEGTDIDEDYKKVLGAKSKESKKTRGKKESNGKASETETTTATDDNHIIEVGQGGVDISS